MVGKGDGGSDIAWKGPLSVLPKSCFQAGMSLTSPEAEHSEAVLCILHSQGCECGPRACVLAKGAQDTLPS